MVNKKHIVIGLVAFLVYYRRELGLYPFVDLRSQYEKNQDTKKFPFNLLSLPETDLSKGHLPIETS